MALHLSKFRPTAGTQTPKNPLFDPKIKVVPRVKLEVLKRVSGETATFSGTPPGPKIPTFSDSGRGSIGRTDENSDQNMDQNATKTNHIPDEIRVKKVSKRHETAKKWEKVAAPAAGGGGENSDQNLDQNMEKTSIVPNEIRKEKLSKSQEMADFGKRARR